MRSFKMPAVQVSDWVLWRHDRESPPVAALVTKVNPDSIGCTVFYEGNANGMCKEGVHHSADYRQGVILEPEDGFWEHPPHIGGFVYPEHLGADNPIDETTPVPENTIVIDKPGDILEHLRRGRKKKNEEAPTANLEALKAAIDE